jgi:sorting and assembly machinery component 37
LLATAPPSAHPVRAISFPPIPNIDTLGESASPANYKDPDLLPALRHDGAWISGYAAITSHLVAIKIPDRGLGLTDAQDADILAYSTYLATRARPLLDLSLYVSAENWSEVTRPALTAALPFPLGWTVPPALRATAVQRVAAIGLKNLDADMNDVSPLSLSLTPSLTEEKREKATKLDIQWPREFLAGLEPERRTVLESMAPDQVAAIPLVAEARKCLAVLDDLRPKWEDQKGDAKKRRFFYPDDGSISSFDCLAFGYLALMDLPTLPRNWLQAELRRTFPQLHRFVQEMNFAVLQSQPDPLPWVAAPPAALQIARRFLHDIVLRIPTVGQVYHQEWRRRAEKKTNSPDGNAVLLGAGILAAASAVGFTYYLYHASFGAPLQVWMAEKRRSRLSEFGDLESMLNVMFAGAGVAGTAQGWTEGAQLPQSNAAGTADASDVD